MSGKYGRNGFSAVGSLFSDSLLELYIKNEMILGRMIQLTNRYHYGVGYGYFMIWIFMSECIHG